MNLSEVTKKYEIAKIKTSRIEKKYTQNYVIKDSVTITENNLCGFVLYVDKENNEIFACEQAFWNMPNWLKKDIKDCGFEAIENSLDVDSLVEYMQKKYSYDTK